MKATADRRTLADTLTWALQAVPRRPAMPVLSGAHLQASDGHLTVRTTDFDTWHTATIDADVVTPGTVVVSAHRLRDVVANARGDRLDLIVDTDKLTVRAGRSTYTFRTLPAADYPTPIEHQAGTTVVASADSVRHLLATTAAAVAGGTDVLPELRCIGLTSDGTDLTGCTSDRYRASVATVTARGDELEAAVEHHAFSAAAQTMPGDVTLTVAGGLCTVADEHRHATIRLLAEDRKFPRIAGMFPDPSGATAACTVDADEISAALHRITALAEPNTPAHLDATCEPVVVRSRDGEHGVGEEAVDATTTGPFDVWLHPLYLADLVDACPDGAVDIHTWGPTRPVLVTPSTSTRQQHLCMPVRANTGS